MRINKVEWKLFLMLWLAGLSGIVALTLSLLPQVLAGQELPMPLWVIQVLSILQPAILLAIAVWVGIKLAAPLGLAAPAFEALAGLRARDTFGSALRKQCLPACIAALAGGCLLYLLGVYGPESWRPAQGDYHLPLLARILYGGIVEELLLRWGVMTLLVWLGGRFLQGRQAPPAVKWFWLAIVLSALLFAAGHLPAAAISFGGLDATITSFILAANSIFGLLFGWLFWRYGLEAAILAHAGSHAIQSLISSLLS